MHLRFAARCGEGEAAHQPAQILVRQPRRGEGKRRLRGHLSPQTAAGGVPCDAGDGLVADLSLPCSAGPDAAASDRHGPIQIHRVQAQRDHQGGAQPGLLESRPAVPRCDRIPDRQRRLDSLACLHRGQDGRLSRRDDAATQGYQEPDAAGGVRPLFVEHAAQPDRQPAGATFRQPRPPPGDVADG